MSNPVNDEREVSDEEIRAGGPKPRKPVQDVEVSDPHRLQKGILTK